MPIPLVLVPGIVCDEAVWAAQIEAFRSERPVVVADHGTLDSLADMAGALLDRAPARFALAGHSMGGRVALEVMRVASQRVTRLALLDTGYEALDPGVAGLQEKKKRYALLEIARERGMRAMAIEWARGMVHPDRLSDAPLIERLYDMISRKTPDQFAAQIRALLLRPNVADILAAIRVPTLVLCGKQDAWAPWPRHVDIAERVADSVLIGVERCGHMSPMEQPEQVTTALRDWLASAPADL
jgi:pimeloyl-ACP methyl ester carboxylesterase